MFKLAKILLPVDFSGRSCAAAHYAVRLAERFGSEITVLHVLPPHFEFGSVELGSAMLIDLIVERQARANERMAAFLADELAGLAARSVIREGDPATEIVEYAHSGSFDLIVMPTHGHGLFRRLLLGSVTAKVLHDAECPVWTGAHLDSLPAPWKGPGRVLCAVDLGPASSRALNWATRIAQEFQAPLTIVHAIAALDPRTETFHYSPEWRRFLVETAEKQLAELQRSFGASADAKVLMGHAAYVVCEEAEQLQAGLVVIGRSAAGALGRLKSNAYAIIRGSPCPVASV